MLTLNVSVSGGCDSLTPKLANADVVEVVTEGLFRAEIAPFFLPNSRSVKIVAHSGSLDGCFAIVVADGDLVLAQAAGRVSPYLNLWIRIDGFDLLAHVERGHQRGEQAAPSDGGKPSN
jgi:hypothetical protein